MRTSSSALEAWAHNILIQLFKKTSVYRHSALDAESSDFKFQCVTVFNDSGCRVGARHDVTAVSLQKLSNYNFTLPSTSHAGGPGLKIARAT